MNGRDPRLQGKHKSAISGSHSLGGRLPRPHRCSLGDGDLDRGYIVTGRASTSNKYFLQIDYGVSNVYLSQNQVLLVPQNITPLVARKHEPPVLEPPLLSRPKVIPKPSLASGSDDRALGLWGSGEVASILATSLLSYLRSTT